MPKLQISPIASTLFRLNGLDYGKNQYQLVYNNVQQSDGTVDESLIQVGLFNKSSQDFLVQPTQVNTWTDSSDTPYASLADLITALESIVGFNEGGGGVPVEVALVYEDEGNGVGIIRNGRVADNYGDVGSRAVDLGYSTNLSEVVGATGLYSVVSGGRNNISSSTYSVVSGGGSNTASGGLSVVAGGASNNATENYSVVSGGNNNNALGSYSVVSGGQANIASGAYSIVAGGNTNVASGDNSFAAGLGNSASSFAEVTIGRNATTYTPVSQTAFSSSDRIFTVGVGGVTSDIRRDALCVLKLGTVGIGYSNFEAVTNTSTLAVNGTIRTLGYVVSALPPSPDQGARAYVTDATATTFNSIVAGGGSNVVPVFYDGTNWVIG